MTCKRSVSIRIFRALIPFFASLTLLIGAVAQQTGANQSPNKQSTVLKQQSSRATATELPVSFAPVATYDSGGLGANAVAVGDFNSDGRLDLVVANFTGVGILLGNGDGTFQHPLSYSLTGNTANAVAIADLNGDGHLDLAIASRYSSSVFVLLGNGDGTFNAPVEYDSGGIFGTSVAIADLNDDGHPDLVVANVCQYANDCLQSVVGVLLGKGNGTFQPPVVYGSGGYYANSVAIADLNGDGHPDLVAVSQCYDTQCDPSSGGPASVLLGNGDGSFQPAVDYGSGGGSPVSVGIADLNDDGRPDLAVVKSSSNGNDKVGILLGNGDGTFQSPVSYPSGGYGATAVAIGDLNGDGKLDLAVSNDFNNPTTYGFGTVGVLLGNGNGTFQTAVSFTTAEYLSNSVAIADVNGDGKPDLLVADYCEGVNGNCPSDNTLAGTVGVLLNNTPFCTTPPVTTLSTSLTSLWPPNGKMIPVTVSGTIRDAGCAITSSTYAVTDSYGQVQPSGAVTLGAGGAYSFTVLLQASRLGTDLDGRSYKVTVRASNNAGRTGSKVVNVIVPHDQGH